MRHVVLALIVALAAGGCALFTDFSDLSDASDPPAGPDDASTPAEAASPSPVEIVASGQVRPTALTLHQGQLYWVDAAPNAGIMTTRVGANMSPSVIARTSETPSSVAIGGGLLFWSLPNAGEVWEASPTGQGAKAITDSHAGAQSLVHAGTLY